MTRGGAMRNAGVDAVAPASSALQVVTSTWPSGRPVPDIFFLFWETCISRSGLEIQHQLIRSR